MSRPASRIAVPPAGPVLHRSVSLGAALLLVTITLFAYLPAPATAPAGALRYPAESAGRLFERHLELFHGLEEASPWTRRFLGFVYGSREQTHAEALAAFREVLAYLQSHPERAEPWTLRNTRARLLILLGETGALRAGSPELERMEDTLEGEVIADAVRFAYLDGPASGEVLTGIRLLPQGWATDTLGRRVAARLGEARWEARAARSLAERAERWRSRSLYFGALTAALLGGGLALAAWFLRHPRRLPRWQARALDAPWELGRGLGIWARAGAIGLTLFALLRVRDSMFEANPLVLWATLLASLPMLWLMHRYLLAPRGWGFRDAFGLGLRGVRPWQLAAAVLVLLALEKAGGMLIGWVSWELGARPHWASGFAESWIWATPAHRYLSAVDAVAWAPICEEIGFRGLLYVSLRARLAAWPAALASAAVFSAMHLYSLPSALAVFWSGLLLALAFEHLRSLWPGILAHAGGNALAILMAVSFYR